MNLPQMQNADAVADAADAAAASFHFAKRPKKK